MGKTSKKDERKEGFTSLKKISLLELGLGLFFVCIIGLVVIGYLTRNNEDTRKVLLFN